MLRNNRGMIHIHILNPIISLVFLIYIGLALFEAFSNPDPPEYYKFLVDMYFITFFPIVLSFIITPVKLSEVRLINEHISRALIVAIVLVRIVLPLGWYYFMNENILQMYSDIPDWIYKRYETVTGCVSIIKKNEYLEKNSILEFSVENKMFSVYMSQ